MTTDDLQKGLPAARRSALRSVSRSLFCATALCLTSVCVQAKTAPASITPEPIAKPTLALTGDAALTSDAMAGDARSETVAATAKTAQNSVREKAAAAAAATLTALLPRLAASDSMPILDRSAMFAGDLSRLLANYDLNQSGAIMQAGTQAGSGGKVQAVLQRALTLLGTPYRWGGTSPDSGFDCSGLVGYVFHTALGIDLPRVSRDMASKTDAELIRNRNELKQGDLVFFGHRGRVNHVGIYVGEGRFLHSPSTGKDVRVDSLLTGYWSAKFMQARRLTM
ncbi:C40 family peptidase [Pseudoxanthomonas yeongjuensis]|uniref:C40 family peptidase n=1 Tax=Pseudoxanthomonas yeongjuensis TaxID=377616 RepID=UPI001B88217B